MQDTKTKKTSVLSSVEALPEPGRSELKAALSELVLLQIVNRLDEEQKISDDQLDELEQSIQDGKTPQEVRDWFRNSVPGFDETVDGVLSDIDANLLTQLGITGNQSNATQDANVTV